MGWGCGCSHPIGWSHRNIGRFTGVNEHCSFTSVNRPTKRSSGLLPAGIFGHWGLFRSTPSFAIIIYLLRQMAAHIKYTNQYTKNTQNTV